jgi:hypothetical protein
VLGNCGIIFTNIGYWGIVFISKVGHTSSMCANPLVWGKTHEAQFSMLASLSSMFLGF